MRIPAQEIYVSFVNVACGAGDQAVANAWPVAARRSREPSGTAGYDFSLRKSDRSPGVSEAECVVIPSGDGDGGDAGLAQDRWVGWFHRRTADRPRIVMTY